MIESVDAVAVLVEKRFDELRMLRPQLAEGPAVSENVPWMKKSTDVPSGRGRIESAAAASAFFICPGSVLDSAKTPLPTESSKCSMIFSTAAASMASSIGPSTTRMAERNTLPSAPRETPRVLAGVARPFHASVLGTNTSPLPFTVTSSGLTWAFSKSFALSGCSSSDGPSLMSSTT